MNTIIKLMSHGFQNPDVALFLSRAVVGIFFTMSGMNKLFVASRHQSLVNNLTKNGIKPLAFMSYWVPFWEFASGIMVTIGLLAPFNAGVLLIICIVACTCELRERVAAYKPINTADEIADYLYIQDVLYMALLAVVIFAGSGRYSVDALI